MKIKHIIIAATFVFHIGNATAQTFISKAVVEYEVKTSIKKTLGGSRWAEMMKDNLPDFKTGYFHYTFADNKSLYRFHHWDEKVKLPDFYKKSDEENSWYFDHTLNVFNMQKNVVGTNFNVQDSIPNIEWKLTNENRIIAGFNCRKAVGVIMDSVYVFAFYSEEIMIPGGPCSISGLPGLILGMTIPRMYTSWIATKVMVNDVPVSNIKPVTAKKYLTKATLKGTVQERISEWMDADDPDSKMWMNQFIWGTML